MIALFRVGADGIGATADPPVLSELVGALESPAGLDPLALHGQGVNRKRVRRLLLKMSITAIYPKPRTTRAGRGLGHKLFLYLLFGAQHQHRERRLVR